MTPLRAARQATGHTQWRFAALAGVSQHSLCDWESGKRTPRNPKQRALLLALGMNWEDRASLWPECVGRGVGLAAVQRERNRERRR